MTTHAIPVTPQSPAFFRRALRWMGPLMILALLQVVSLKTIFPSGQKIFSDDEAYLNLAVMRQLSDGAGYGLVPGETLPPCRDGLTHLVLVGLGTVFPEPEQTLWFVMGLCGVCLVLVGVRMGGVLMPLNGMRIIAGVAVATAPLTHKLVLSGTGDTLAAVCFFLGVLLHLEGLRGRRGPLSALSAMAIGLTVMIHPIFVLWWIALWAHAVMHKGGDTQVGRVTAFLQGLGGLAVIAVMLWPLVDQHFYLLNIPWPGSFDAGLYKPDLLPVGEVIRGGFRRFIDLGSVNGVLGWVLWVGGSICVFFGGAPHRERKGFGIVALAPLVSLVFAIIGYYGFGWRGGETMLVAAWAVQPVLWAYVVFRGLDWIASKGALPEIMQRRPVVLGCGAGAIVLVLMGCIALGSFLKAERVRLESRAENRMALTNLLDQLPPDAAVWTDQVGWVAYQSPRPVTDLTAVRAPRLLNWMNADGSFSPERIEQDLAREKPALLVVHSSLYLPHAEAVVEVAGSKSEVVRPYPSAPDMWRFTW